MHFSKISISIVSIISALTLLAATQVISTNNSKKDITASTGLHHSNIDSIILNIKTNGWKDEYISECRFQIINADKKSTPDLEKLFSSLPNNSYKSFVAALFLKKREKIKEMYDTLVSILDTHPKYFSFYEELVFSARATNQLTLLQSLVNDKIKSSKRQYNFLLGLTSAAQGNYEDAANYFEAGLKRFPDNKFLLYNLYYAYRYLGNYDKAMNELNALSKIINENDLFFIPSLLAKGSLNFLSGDYKKAKSFYKSALLKAKTIYDKQNEANAKINLGLINDVNGDVYSARENFKKGLEIAESINDLELTAYAHSELGVSYSYTNELIESKENYLSSYKLYKKVGNVLRLSLLSSNIAKIYQTMFDYKSAIKYYEQGIEFAGENKRAHAISLRGLADVYTNVSDYSKALEYYKEAFKISAKIKDLSLQSGINSGLGTLNYNLNRFNSALKLFKEARNLSTINRNPYYSADLDYKIGLSYLQLDSLSLAENSFINGIKSAGEANDFITESSNIEGLSQLLINTNKLEEAKKYIARLHQISQQNNWDYLSSIKCLLEGEINKLEDNFNAAKNNFEQAIKFADKANESSIKIEAYHYLALLFEEHSLNEAAKSYYTTATKIIEDVSRPMFRKDDIQISYFASNRTVYDDYINYLLNQKKYESAFNEIERSRSRNTVQNLNGLKFSSLINDEKTLNKIYQYDWIINSGIYTKHEIDSVKNILSSIETELIDKKPQLKKYFNFNYTLGENDIQKQLTDKEQILSYYSTNENTYLFILSKNNFNTIKIDIKLNRLKKIISQVSSYFSHNPDVQKSFYNQDLFSFNAEAANNLYKLLFEPAKKYITNDQDIIIIPSLDLVSIPFEFLVTTYDKNESPYNYSNKQFLIYDYNISYSPSATVFIDQQLNMLKNNGSSLVMGNPSINGNEEGYAERRGLLEESGGLPRNIALLPLKYSGEEINEVSQILNTNKVLTEKEATETNFKENAQLSRVIHLSTHSFLFNKQPLIFFSNSYDPDNDGFLEASEISQLKLNSDLVVLSSCNSGLGSVDESEGILGMTKAFFEAGSKSVVVSLWEVNDKYTSKFMQLFYERLNEGFNKSKALRMAKIDFIKKYSANPYFWGAFVLSGNIGKLNIIKSTYSAKYIFVIMGLILLSIAAVFIIRKKKQLKLIASN